ncbi:threonine synthase [Stella humosa]|uniref:Threonine synthase n=1 Tax=Stella humosa TaxID=94 RepID=A0A3N1LHV5_9PROT|nr:threonine synthase [Stella humosa]ROP91117.1 threonine synthase [Stella humosa]BBK34531.1 threonine synthase [Stella humosa]
MRYVSTRGAAPALAFDDVLLAGLARDGGLYVPDAWPTLTADDLRALARADYAETVTRVMAPFVDGAIAEDDLAALVTDAYRSFAHSAIVPLKQLGPNQWMMELFHGPTLAFKDLALQVVGRLFDHVLARRGRRVTIVGATSGDTGSAAMEACRDREGIDIFILFPEGRVSEVQRRQMTTIEAANVHAIAVQGTFDDCQDMVKAMFNDIPFRDRHGLSAVNSINWARIAAQIAYYVWAAVALGAPARAVSFAVPTGNFGNVFAAHAARHMGLPIASLAIGTNRNDILTRFLETGSLSIGTVEPSLSPSMDIQVSSNFERLLFELFDRDGKALAGAMADFRRDGVLAVSPERWARAKADFAGFRLDDAGTLETIRRVWQSTGEILDPHSAIGVATAEACRVDPAVPIVALACAHPAKFPDAVERATGIRPALPGRLSDLLTRPERVSVLPNDLATVQDFVAARTTRQEQPA